MSKISPAPCRKSSEWIENSARTKAAAAIASTMMVDGSLLRDDSLVDSSTGCTVTVFVGFLVFFFTSALYDGLLSGTDFTVLHVLENSIRLSVKDEPRFWLVAWDNRVTLVTRRSCNSTSPTTAAGSWTGLGKMDSVNKATLSRHSL